MSRKRFSHLVPSDLDTRSFFVKSAFLVTLVDSYVSTKLLVSMAFLLRENWRHRMDRRRDKQTDRWTGCNA